MKNTKQTQGILSTKKEYLTKGQVMQELAIGEKTYYKLINTGLIPRPLKLGPHKSSPVRHEKKEFYEAVDFLKKEMVIT